ncbi:hypothetical protein QBC44DRAFT_372250 [Cladorrhinum sp. PSN332]|nr:hypothetical protein QBC44DRAFT_372250 [Cladorrhinum sp. PSN332]
MADNVSKTGCYYPDGSPADGRHADVGIPVLYPCSNFDPTNPTPAVCCELGDFCISKKLCSRQDRQGNTFFMYRGGCTDPANPGDFCPDKCTHPEDPFFDPLNTTVEVVPCARKPLPTVAVVCEDSGISSSQCSADGQSVTGSVPIDNRQGFMMNASETHYVMGIAGVPASTASLAESSTAPATESAMGITTGIAIPSRNSSDTGSTGITGGALIAAIVVPVTVTVAVLISCLVIFFLLRRKIRREDAEGNQTDNNNPLPEPAIPMVSVTSPSPFQPEGGGNELDATPGSASNRQELDPSPTITLWPSGVMHRPTQSYPSEDPPVLPFPPPAANGRPASLSLSHTLPALSPLSPLSPLDSEYYRPSSMLPESVELPTNRAYMPYRPPLHTSEDDAPTGLSAPPRDTRALRRSSTAPGAIWADHPHPLASNPPFDEPTTTNATTESGTQTDQHDRAVGWEDRFTETGPAA